MDPSGSPEGAAGKPDGIADPACDSAGLDAALLALARDWSFLGVRLRELDHQITTNCARLRLRLHYPSLRDAQATVGDLVDAVSLLLSHFCLPRSEIDALHASQSTLDPFSYQLEVTKAHQRSVDLFIRAQAESNRNGEAGELILFLLTEWVLQAPQIIAKMSLKTSRDMAVHGADGVHVRHDAKTGRLILYSGEAKLHKNVGGAIRSAVDSIGKAVSHSRARHELDLVQRNIDFSGLNARGKAALLDFLDPFSPKSNDRIDVVTCLIGFDFDGYAGLARHEDGGEAAFREVATAELARAGAMFADALGNAGLEDRRVELFLLPLPSVATLRDLFQERIGWRPT